MSAQSWVSKFFLVLSAWALVLSSFFLTPQAQADENLDVALRSLYEIKPPNTTLVTHTITFTNNNPTVNVKQFGFKIANPDLKQVQVAETNSETGDPEEVQSPETNIVTTDDETSIGISFENELVGQNKSRTLVISYTDEAIAQFTSHSGFAFIPAIVETDLYDTFTVSIQLPSELKLRETSKNEISLAETSTSTVSADTIYTLNQPTEKPLSLYFGETQPVSFELEYTFTNESDSPLIQQALLPPTTPYQQISFTELQPEPESISLDEAGNWIASYRVPAQSSLSPQIKGQAKLSALPAWDETPPSKKLLEPTTSWPTESELLTNLFTAGLTDSPNASEVYLPVESLILSQENQTETGLISAIESQTPIIPEQLSDVLITGHRIHAYPARKVLGVTWISEDPLRPLVRPNQNLHVWTEAWYDREWHLFDPYWNRTTQGQDYLNQNDLTRLALAFHISDQLSPEPSDLVSVSVSPLNQFIAQELDLSLVVNPKKIWNYPVPGLHVVEIRNNSGQAHLQKTLNITSPNGDIHTISMPPLLPFQTIEAPFKLKSGALLGSNQGSVQLSVDDVTETINLTTGSLFIYHLFGWPGVVLGVTSIIIPLVAGSLLVFRRR